MVRCPQQNPSVVLREEIDNNALLYNMERDEVFLINRSAFIIWKLCDGTRSHDQITEELKKNFAVSEEIEERIDAYLKYLYEKNLVIIDANNE